MPYETFSTYATSSAEDSAAQEQEAYEDFSDSVQQPMDAEFFRPRLRMVSNGYPFEEEDEDEVETEPESDNWYDSVRAFEARLEARMDGGYANSIAPFMAVVEKGEDITSAHKKAGRSSKPTSGSNPRYPGLKKHTDKQIAEGIPPTPRGCEWRRSDEGLNLWRCWTEWDEDKTQRIKKSRYAGNLTYDGWQVMKEYDYEAYISNIGERLRRHGGR
jgi:hypothetical protein